jgi:hypothetical protein
VFKTEAGQFCSFAVTRETPMQSAQLTLLVIQPLIALIFGILILIIPRLLNYLVAFYLIFVGIAGLWPQLLPATA